MSEARAAHEGICNTTPGSQALLLCRCPPSRCSTRRCSAHRTAPAAYAASAALRPNRGMAWQRYITCSIHRRLMLAAAGDEVQFYLDQHAMIRGRAAPDWSLCSCAVVCSQAHTSFTCDRSLSSDALSEPPCYALCLLRLRDCTPAFSGLAVLSSSPAALLWCCRLQHLRERALVMRAKKAELAAS